MGHERWKPGIHCTTFRQTIPLKNISESTGVWNLFRPLPIPDNSASMSTFLAVGLSKSVLNIMKLGT